MSMEFENYDDGVENALMYNYMVMCEEFTKYEECRCDFCNLTASHPYLKRENKFKDTPHWLKNYACEKCGCEHDDVYQLMRHRAFFHYSNFFKCKICSQEFVLKSQLVEHKESHRVETSGNCLEEDSISDLISQYQTLLSYEEKVLNVKMKFLDKIERLFEEEEMLFILSIKLPDEDDDVIEDLLYILQMELRDNLEELHKDQKRFLNEIDQLEFSETKN